MNCRVRSPSGIWVHLGPLNIRQPVQASLLRLAVILGLPERRFPQWC